MKKLFICLALGGFTTIGHGSEQPLVWPQFRGPNGSGVADGQKPPLEIGHEKNLKWKVPVPRGLSSPIFAGDKLVMTAFDGGKLYTIAYDRTNGREIWRTEARAKQIEAFHKTEGSPAASTPATDGKQIVSYFGSCGLFCYDLNGKELWNVQMPPAELIGEFGSGVSPIIAEDIVVLVRGSKEGLQNLRFRSRNRCDSMGAQSQVSAFVLHANRLDNFRRPANRGRRARPHCRIRFEDRNREMVRRQCPVGVLFFTGHCGEHSVFRRWIGGRIRYRASNARLRFNACGS